MLHILNSKIALLVYLFFLTAYIPASWHILAISAAEILSGLLTSIIVFFYFNNILLNLLCINKRGKK
jgi:hypothetical protein